MMRGHILRMSDRRVQYEAWKQDRRQAARDTHGDAWTGMNASLPDPATVSRQVNAEIKRYLAAREGR